MPTAQHWAPQPQEWREVLNLHLKPISATPSFAQRGDTYEGSRGCWALLEGLMQLVEASRAQIGVNFDFFLECLSWQNRNLKASSLKFSTFSFSWIKRSKLALVRKTVWNKRFLICLFKIGICFGAKFSECSGFFCSVFFFCPTVPYLPNLKVPEVYSYCQTSPLCSGRSD